MDLSNIYVHDATLLRVIEDTEKETLTMECRLPADEWSDDFVPGRLIFEDVLNYRVCEGPCVGPPVILDLAEIQETDGRSLLRIETTHGFRELPCVAVRVVRDGAHR